MRSARPLTPAIIGRAAEDRKVDHRRSPSVARFTPASTPITRAAPLPLSPGDRAASASPPLRAGLPVHACVHLDPPVNVKPRACHGRGGPAAAGGPHAEFPRPV